MAKKVLIILAEGFEEIEAITPIDVLRRAGLDVIIAGVSSETVAGAHGVQIQTDILLEEYYDVPDAVILPGGAQGAQNLAASSKVSEIIKKANHEKKLIGAICAAPAIVLAPLGVLNQRKATCYPSFEKKFPSSVVFTKDRLVVDGNIVTSRGPGSAFEFAIQIAEMLTTKQKAETLKEGMLIKG